MAATNEVAAAAAEVVADVGNKASNALGTQVEQGRQAWDQVVAWLTEKGVDCAVNLVVALLILLVGMVVIKLIKLAVNKWLVRANRGGGLLAKFVGSVITKSCWALLLMIVLERLGVNVGPLIAGLGVTGFILGFAFQESLGNLASGLMIAINEPFKVGDYISAGGIGGSVQELNMMATVLTTGDNKKVVLPNKSVWGSPITNFSAMATRRVDFAIGVPYGSDLGKAKELACATLASLDGVLNDPLPFVEVSSFEDSEVALALRVWCKNADYWNVYFAGQRAVLEAFEKNGFDVPFPQLCVHLDK